MTRPVFPAACSCTQVVSRNVEEQARGLRHWRQRYDQLSLGAFEGRVTDIWINRTQFFRESINCRTGQSGQAWQGSYVIAFPLDLGRGSLFAEQPVPPDSILCLRGGQEFSLITQRDSDILGLAIGGKTLMEVMDPGAFRQFDDGFPGKPSVLGGNDREIVELRNILAAIIDEFGSRSGHFTMPLIYLNVEAVVAGCLASLLSSLSAVELPSRSFRGRCQLVREITAYALAHAENGVSMADLCAHFGLSRRMLNYCFREVLAVNPVLYFRLLRLNAVRKDLLAAGGAGELVRDVAEKWGFFHFSRFSAEYHELFGEYPSATLNRK